MKSYFYWFLNLIHLSKHDYNSPYFFIFFTSTLISSGMLILGTSKIGAWAGPIAASSVFKRNVVEDSPGLLPSFDEKELAKKVAAVPKREHFVDSASRTSKERAKPGSRDIPIGIDKNRNVIYINERELSMHSLVFGSTGSGKTEYLKNLAGSLLDLGWNGMILDLKEDIGEGGLREWCEDYAAGHSIKFQDFSLSYHNPTFWFSALDGVTPDQARDTILASQVFEDAYYRSLNENQLGQLITLLYACNEVNPELYPEPTVYEIGRILSQGNVRDATSAMVKVVLANMDHFTSDDFNTLVKPDKIFTDTAAGLGARLTAMYQTKVGRTILKPGEGREKLNVLGDGITYVGLSSGAMPEISRLISTSILRRMAILVADRISNRSKERRTAENEYSRRFIIVDEANFVERRILLELLSRARSANVTLIVCTQGPSDWAPRVQGEPDLTSLVTNSNVTIIMNQGERKNAELCADMIGREERLETTQRIDETGVTMEAGSVRKTEDYVVNPEDLRSLGIGEAVVRVGKPGVRRFWVQVNRRDPKMQTINL